MATTLKTKNSVTATVAPTTLQQGELAVNITDKKMWVGNAATTPVQIVGTGSGGGGAAGSNTQVQYNSSGALAGDADFTFNGTTVTMANDASISGLTVGKGGGAVSTNTVVGSGALTSSNTGLSSVFGYQAGFGATGAALTAIGYQAGYSNTDGNGGVFVGYQSGKVNTTGEANVGVGANTLLANTTGSFNVSIGKEALRANTTASQNTAVGYQAGYSNVTGASQTFVGYQAGYGNTGGSNTFVGFGCGTSSTSGTGNTAIGRLACIGNVGGSGSNNTAVGDTALYNNTTASNNTAVGYQAGYSNTTGTEITAVGLFAAYATTTGNYATAFGARALAANTTGTNNVAVGREASTTSTTASNNTSIGHAAGYVQTGSNNTHLGSVAGFSLTTGQQNTFLGYASGYNMTTGGKNVIVGSYNGNQGGLDIRTANNYIVLSDGDGNPRVIGAPNGSVGIGINPSSVRSGGNVLLLSSSSAGGQSLTVDPGDYSFGLNYTINSGNYYTQSYYASKISFYNGVIQTLTASSGTAGNSITYTTGPYVSVGGTSWTNSSDENLKNITGTIENALDKICQLRAAKFTWKTDAENKPQVGLIAQDLQKVLPEVVVVPTEKTDQNGNPTHLGVNYDQVIPLLLAGIQELKAEVDSLKQQLGK